MKSRISFFDKAILRKDITRFAPLWAIYLIGGLLVMLMIQSGRPSSHVARTLAQTIGPFSVINLVYALLCAQLLFGDLFHSRLCNALHALPLRRETWFVSHVVSGLAFSLVPHLIAVILMVPMLQGSWFVGLIWVLGMTLEFLCFFGIGVFSMFCTGNRFAAVAVYAILNFASLIAYWFVSTIYEPMLYGVSIPTVWFRLLCPVAEMASNEELVLFDHGFDFYGETIYLYRGLDDDWWYLAICAAVGIGLLLAALALYRRRKLEHAGDFIAVKSVEPVFAVILTICIGGVFAMVEQLFLDSYLVFLCAGLIIGWFVSQMLLQRTVKVFRGKTFLKLAVLLLALGTSILMTWLDPLGITIWVPEPGDVKVAEMDLSSSVNEGSSDYLQLRDMEDIRKIIAVHENLVEDRSILEESRSRRITVRYTMKDGRRISRTYRMYSHTKAWPIVEGLYSTPEQIMGYTDWESYIPITDAVINGTELMYMCKHYDSYLSMDKETSYLKQYEAIKRSLLEAIRKDCESGAITRDLDGDKPGSNFWIELHIHTGKDYRIQYKSINVSKDCTNILQWMAEYRKIVESFVPQAYQ